MATLNIGGKRVKVGDEFLSLTPEQQQATVDEIAAKIGMGAPTQPTTTDPGFNPYETGATKLAGGPGVQPEQSLLDKFGNATMATVNGLSASVPFLQNTTDAIGGTISQLMGGDYGDYVQRQKGIREGYAEKAPWARIGGEVGGMIAGTGVLGASKLGAEAMGLSGGFFPRLGNSIASSAGLSTLDALSNGRSGMDALASAGIGGGMGALQPIVGGALRIAGKGLNDSVIQPIASMMNADNAATANLGRAIGADKRAGAFMSADDVATANKAGVPLMNVDRFGDATRKLARTASNIDTESAGQFARNIEDRFKAQGLRAVNFVKMLMGGATDDLKLQDVIRKTADQANNIAYAKASANPKARAIWSPEIRQLLQSDKFRAAVNAAESRGSDKAAISGMKAVKNPFKFDEFGEPALKMRSDRAYERLQTVLKTGDEEKIAAAKAAYEAAKVNDGPDALPSLEFWNQVKINLDGMISAAKPTATNAGDRALYADLNGIKQKLLSSLDSAVPEYAAARKGAFEFFGAEDAIDAGRKAVLMTKEVPELQRAHAAFKPAEKDAAAVGYASQLIDEIADAGDGRNLMIAKLFNSPSARARNELFLGPQRARELEAYVRVESIVDKLRGAVKGNSSTAEQLIAAGAIGTGVTLGTGNVQQGFGWAVAAGLGMKGLKMMGKNVDQEIMRKVAEALVSNDPAKIERAIQNASLSKEHMLALEGIMRGLAIGSRGSALAAGEAMQPEMMPRAPVQLTVTGGNPALAN